MTAERYTGAWECLVKPGRRLKAGTRILFGDGDLTGLVVGVVEESGARLVQFSTHGADRVMDLVHRIGDGNQIGFVAGIVIIFHPVFDGTRSDGREKCLRIFLALQPRFEVFDLRLK